MIGTSQYESNMPFLAFLISVTSTSFIYTYLYNRTNASIFSAILLHWLYTYVIQVISSSIVRSTMYNWLEAVSAVLIGSLFAFIMRKGKRLFNK